jgi:hypothetical protein
MHFDIDADLPVPVAQLWDILFDISRIAGLIPGCENVQEVIPKSQYTALMKQKIGPFKFEVPAQIIVEQMQTLQSVRLRVSGKDKFTATTINVLMDVLLSADQTATKLQLHADLQIAGRLATLGYPVIKKKSVELFNEFESRLRALLEIH